MKLRETFYHERITGAFTRFEQAERNLDVPKGRAESCRLGRSSLQNELAGLESDEAVKEELHAMKEVRHGRPTSMSTRARFPSAAEPCPATKSVPSCIGFRWSGRPAYPGRIAGASGPGEQSGRRCVFLDQSVARSWPSASPS